MNIKRFIMLLAAAASYTAVMAGGLISQKPNYENIADWLEFGRKHLRRAYRAGASGPYAFDCSGFTMYMFRQLGISLPHTSAGQAEYGDKVSEKHAAVGDLVFYKGRSGSAIGHVGIIIAINEDGTFDFIHAATSTGVCINRSDHEYYKSRFKGIRRITDDDEIAEYLGIKRKSKRHNSDEKKEEIEIPVDPQSQIPDSDKVAPPTPQPPTENREQPREEPAQSDDEPNRKERKRVRKHKKRTRDSEDYLKNEEKKQEREKEQQTQKLQPQTYTVNQGDTMYRISKTFGITVEQLQQWNGLSGTALSIGQVLIVSQP